ncbi:MAG TPA: alpha/beta fold hydrolase [Dehalococcoidia bacterium]|nr:alpha/beta fold hydrolase [Dehalococcoidia bacterium]
MLPPLLLVHGAANGAWVWDFWRRELKALGWDANVLDLRGHGRSLPVDFTTVTMEDYVADVESVTAQMRARLGAEPVLFGWSMGGLVAMMYAAWHPEAPALVTLAPSPPLQVQGRGDPEEVRKTPSAPFGPELYGVYPDEPERSAEALFDLTPAERDAVLERSRGALESGFARRQRKRGIDIRAGAVRCPALVLYGEQDRHFPPDLNRRIALYLGADTIAVPDAGHWGLVYSERAVTATAPRVDAWLRRHVG